MSTRSKKAEYQKSSLTKMSDSWYLHSLTPPGFKEENQGDPINLIPIMNNPFNSPKPQDTGLGISQQQGSQQRRTMQPGGVPLPCYYTGPPATYIDTLKLNFEQPGAYDVSVRFYGNVHVSTDAASKTTAMAKPIKAITYGSRLSPLPPGPTAKEVDGVPPLAETENILGDADTTLV